MLANRAAKMHKVKDPTIQIVAGTKFKISNSDRIRAVGCT